MFPRYILEVGREGSTVRKQTTGAKKQEAFEYADRARTLKPALGFAAYPDTAPVIVLCGTIVLVFARPCFRASARRNCTTRDQHETRSAFSVVIVGNFAPTVRDSLGNLKLGDKLSRRSGVCKILNPSHSRNGMRMYPTGRRHATPVLSRPSPRRSIRRWVGVVRN